MALTTPTIPYITIRDAILTLLRANYATLNTNLTAAASGGGVFGANDTLRIIPGDPQVVPIPAGLYPAILVKFISKRESFEQLGNAGRKKPVILFKIYAVTYLAEGTPDNEITNLVANIEAVFRDNIAFNANILWSSLGDVRWSIGAIPNGVYVDVAEIDLEVKVEVK